jgi:anti-sigma B factor antagonist
MSTDRAVDSLDVAVPSRAVGPRSPIPDRRPAIRVRAAEGTTVAVILDAEVLFAEEDISHLSEQLHRLANSGPTRLMLDFRGVRWMSSDVLGMLAALHRRLDRSRCRLALCGLDPILRDMLRICRLDRVLDLQPDEEDAPESCSECSLLTISGSVPLAAMTPPLWHGINAPCRRAMAALRRLTPTGLAT